MSDESPSKKKTIDRSVTLLGPDRYELSKYWPDHTPQKSSRFRRVFSTLDQARLMRGRIEHAIVLNQWRELRQELQEKPKADLTIQEFAPVFMEHVKQKNRRPDFHREELDREPDGILAVLGHVRLKEFTRAHATRWEEQRGKSVSVATVNRGLSVLSYLFTRALKRGEIDHHPMLRFGRHREERRALRVMTMDEEAAFVAALLKVDEIVGIYAGLMGETAIRPSEADRLEWSHLDWPRRELAVDISKGKRARYIPLSDFAIELLGRAPRVCNSRRVFVRLETFKPVGDTRAPFAKAQRLTGLDWVHPEDFRHFRATEWVSRGVDLKTVQEYLGHADIHTTMRYAHFAPAHAARSIVEIQRSEAAVRRQLMLGFDRVQESNRRQDVVEELDRIYAIPSTH